ncbi:hypothetical protein EGR_02493 [Echinococcus granulosus]|uniref:Uncharacterized protein n=1 Tax=Echinococcus granulosus TaxID=6210 RepID=W6UW75_ECHGR|nr:hypothetical protein EGR_02493 [Echinococcus granulosus]EUB62697.1 hypothetical protein EGR_02493 [Echinococcus granulosus]
MIRLANQNSKEHETQRWHNYLNFQFCKKGFIHERKIMRLHPTPKLTINSNNIERKSGGHCDKIELTLVENLWFGIRKKRYGLSSSLRKKGKTTHLIMNRKIELPGHITFYLKLRGGHTCLFI